MGWPCNALFYHALVFIKLATLSVSLHYTSVLWRGLTVIFTILQLFCVRTINYSPHLACRATTWNAKTSRLPFFSKQGDLFRLAEFLPFSKYKVLKYFRHFSKEKILLLWSRSRLEKLFFKPSRKNYFRMIRCIMSCHAMPSMTLFLCASSLSLQRMNVSGPFLGLRYLVSGPILNKCNNIYGKGFHCIGLKIISHAPKILPNFISPNGIHPNPIVLFPAWG